MSAEDLAIAPASVAAGDASMEARRGGGFRRLWSRICLTPYGDALLTPGASFWIFSARVAICTMAAAEAIAWSYLGYYIGQSSQPYVTAALTGAAIFLVIWIIDASFITLDSSRSKDEEALLGRHSTGTVEKVKLAAGLIVRLAIISATLFISAPFLAQLVFFRDISAEMSRRDATLIANRRAELAGSFDARTAALLQTRGGLDAASIREAAGAGATGLIGRGPAVATIEKRLDDVDRQLAAVRSEKENALSAYDRLDRQQLKKRYGLGMAEDGIRTRGEILDALTRNATYANAELSIRAFLAFLFLALIVLKLFQPASVSLYFSETFQDLHAQYRSGSFDSWLPPGERSYAKAGLTPLRFRDWCLQNYRSICGDEEQQRRLARFLATRRSHEAELRTTRETAVAESAGLQRDHDTALAALAELQDAAQKMASEINASRQQLAVQERALESMGSTIRSGVTGDAFVHAAEAHARLESEAGNTRAAIRAEEIELDRLNRRLQQQEERTAQLRARLQSREAVVQALDEQLAQLLTDTSAAIASAGA